MPIGGRRNSEGLTLVARLRAAASSLLPVRQRKTFDPAGKPPIAQQ
jgi:hypothetical protein